MAEDEIDDEIKPIKRSPQQAEIARLMYVEKLDYATAYSRVMEPEKTVKKFDWYDSEPTTPQQPKAKQFSVENLQDLADSIDNELENVSTEKSKLREKARSFQEKKEKLVEIGKGILADRERFIQEQKEQAEREKRFNQCVSDYNQKVESFNDAMQKLKELAEQENQKVRGYVKKISVSNEKEFAED